MFRKTLLGLSLLVAGTAFAQEVKTPLYTVVDGYKVDDNTMKGFRTWRQAACDRCHGANQEGMVGPSLVNSLKTLTKEEFVKVVRDGRLIRQPVELGAGGTDSGRVEVRSGLSADDRVVTEPDARLRAGRRARPRGGTAP